MSVVFVHGVSVRVNDYTNLLGRVHQGLLRCAPALHVKGVYWGDLASQLRMGGRSIPGYMQGAKAIATNTPVASTESSPDQILSLMIDDPFLELDAMRDPQGFRLEGGGFEPIPEHVSLRNQTLAKARDVILGNLDGNAEIAAGAGREMPRSELEAIVTRAFDAAGGADRSFKVADLIDPLIRCLTAGLYKEAVAPGEALGPSFNWSVVESCVRLIVESHLGGEKGYVSDYLKNTALSGATFALRHGLRRASWRQCRRSSAISSSIRRFVRPSVIA